ncbi:hypothetical protein IMSHALPRED_010605 [Imshaugia aleurites]|uniref:Uncharacterized protein n=1 Tax=Imshaugia aleurites TaxID=172621 RepID=A0A8H3IB62_9LECA|nr:hypothetical protein IMSHALPRED_010605 [Imshaugia aleurites]
MAATYIPTSPKPGLLAIPGEIRNEIYRILLTTRYNFPNHDISRTALSLHPAILRVNRQINEEAINVLHGDNFWIIAQINVCQWPHQPGANATLPFVSRKDPSHIKYPALHVHLDLPRENSATESTTLIMGVESLPFFLHNLRGPPGSIHSADDLKAAALTLKVYSSPFHAQPKLQSKCLEPFTLVRGFGKYSVMGEPDPLWTWHCEDMMSRATSPFKDAGVVKNIAMDYLAQGDDAYSVGNCLMAYACYGMGVKFVKHAYESLLAYTRTQPHYPHAQQAREQFELEVALGVLRAHSLRPLVALGHHECVTAAGGASLLGTRSLTKVEKVGVIFCRAISYAGLGDRKGWKDSSVDACKLEVTKDDFVQVLLDVCPENLRELMRLGKGCMDLILKLKYMADERRCKEKRRDESTGT